MNDFENREGLEENAALTEEEKVGEEAAESEETASCAQDEENVSQSSELEEELENLKNMFQRELDNAQTILAGGDLQECADENDENSGSEETTDEEIPEEELCECCGERRRDTSVSESYPYCSECRELMRNYPFSAKGILTLIAVIVLSAVSVFYIFGQNAEVIDATLTADSAFAEGKLYSAFNGYYDILTSAGKATPRKVAAKCSKVFAELNDYNDAESILKQFVPEKELKLPTYSRLLKSFDKKKGTINAIEEIVYEPLVAGDGDAEEIKAKLDELKSSDKGSYDEYYIDYYKYVVDFNLVKDKKASYEYLKELDEKYGDKEWVHVFDLCNLSSNLGLVEDTQHYFDVLREKNTEDASAYSCLASAYRFTDKPDPDKMLEIIDEGIEAQGDYTYSSCDLYRVQALAYLLKGEYDMAFAAAYNMYYYVQASQFQVNNVFPCVYTYALCCALYDKTSEYASVETLLINSSQTMSKDVTAVINGEKTVKQVITDSEGDLA